MALIRLPRRAQVDSAEAMQQTAAPSHGGLESISPQRAAGESSATEGSASRAVPGIVGGWRRVEDDGRDASLHAVWRLGLTQDVDGGSYLIGTELGFSQRHCEHAQTYFSSSGASCR